MAAQQVVGGRRAVGVELDAAANVVAVLQGVGRAQAVGLHHHQPRAPAVAGARQPQRQRQRVAVEHRAAQRLNGHAHQVERPGRVALGGLGPAAEFGLDIVAPGVGLLAAPAQQPVVGHGAQAQHGSDDVVAHGLHRAAHDAVVAVQVARAGGERVQVGQQVGVGAAGRRVPAAHGQVRVRGALVGGHAGARAGAFQGVHGVAAGLAFVAGHASDQVDRTAGELAGATLQLGRDLGGLLLDLVGLLLELDAAPVAAGRRRAGQARMERVHEALAQRLKIRCGVVAVKTHAPRMPRRCGHF